MNAELNGIEQRWAVKSIFDARFGEHGLTLPPAAVTHALPGWIRAAGWHAAFRWLRADGNWLLEVDAALLQIGNYNAAIRTVLERRRLHPWPRLEQRALRADARNFDPDAIFARAAEVAAATVDPVKPKASFLERKLEDALRAGLEREIDAARIGARSTRHRVPGWTDRLGGLDLFVEDESGLLMIAAELKIDDVEWVLWDLLKLANLFEAPGFEGAFLAVAADRPVWKSDREGAALLASDPGVCLTWDTRGVLSTWRHSWAELLAGGPARPLYSPDRIEIETLLTAPVGAYTNHELRVASIRPAPDSSSIEFTNGWPTDVSDSVPTPT
jgi:hypothetical protein